MKYAISFSVIILFFCINAACAQKNPIEIDADERSIKSTIEKYFDGWMTGDTTKIGQAMHATCHLKFIRDGSVVNVSRNEYLSNFKPRPKLENTEGRILEIDITRTAAAATCEIERPDRLFTDYFNLLKVGDRWYIVDKISTSIKKE